MRILNTRCETYPLVNGATPVTLIAVLTQGYAGVIAYDRNHERTDQVSREGLTDIAVYVGTVNLPIPGKNMDLYHIAREDAANWIAHNGVKQTFSDARRYFPGLKESEYRA